MTSILLRKYQSENLLSDTSEISDDDSSDAMEDYGKYNGFQSKLFKKLGLCSCILLFLVFLYIPLSSNMNSRMGE